MTRYGVVVEIQTCHPNRAWPKSPFPRPRPEAKPVEPEPDSDDESEEVKKAKLVEASATGRLG